MSSGCDNGPTSAEQGIAQVSGHELSGGWIFPGAAAMRSASSHTASDDLSRAHPRDNFAAAMRRAREQPVRCAVVNARAGSPRSRAGLVSYPLFPNLLTTTSGLTVADQKRIVEIIEALNLM